MSEGAMTGNGQGELAGNAAHYKRDFWAAANGQFAEPHFRLRKAARVVRGLAGDKECDLLDLGCGPAAFARFMPENVHYHGIDIAISRPAPNLIEMDMLESPISFGGMKFDIILAQGLLEYFGGLQSQKFAEIRGLLKTGGKFVVTYTNFAHRDSQRYHAFSNVRQQADFRGDLERYFFVDRAFPGSHNWRGSMPSRKVLQAAQSRLDVNIPVLSRILAVDFFYICSPR